MKTKYFVGLDVHKEKTTFVVRNKVGNILAEGRPSTYDNDETIQKYSYWVWPFISTGSTFQLNANPSILCKNGEDAG